MCVHEDEGYEGYDAGNEKKGNDGNKLSSIRHRAGLLVTLILQQSGLFSSGKSGHVDPELCAEQQAWLAILCSTDDSILCADILIKVACHYTAGVATEAADVIGARVASQSGNGLDCSTPIYLQALSGKDASPDSKGALGANLPGNLDLSCCFA